MHTRDDDPPEHACDDPEAEAVDGDDGDAREPDDTDARAYWSPPDGMEYLGDFASVADYVRSVVEDLSDPSVHWVFDHLDWGAVLSRFEEDGSRYFCEQGRVYRIDSA